MPIDLTPILAHAPAWLLVLFRLTGIFVIAPMLGSETIPRQVKIFLALGLSFCVYPMLLSPAPGSAVSGGTPGTHHAAAHLGAVIEQGVPLWPMTGMIAVELLIGFAIGFAASLPIIGLQIGGQMIDQQMGLGFAGIVNPEMDEEAGIVARTLFMLALTIFILMGGHRAMFAALIGSFDKIPLGGFDNFSGLTVLMVGLLGVVFDMAVRVAAPMLCVMFLVQLALGFIMRTVPQINVLSVGFIVRILLGATFMTAFVAIAAGVFSETVRQVMSQVLQFFTFVK
ncbi:MAG: flagellar biosynthetic protein FliR [Phycisphaeraceae bacterium]|nr:flagellar biosynthetic protein FliR [Phycisphaeraceae bacterium]